MSGDEKTGAPEKSTSPAPADSTSTVPSSSSSSSRRWYLLILAFAVVVAVVVATALVVRHRNGSDIAAAAPIAAVPAVVDAAGSAGADGDGSGSRWVDAVAGALAGPAAAEGLGKLSGHVTDVATGDELWTASPDIALVPASATKLATATAALLTLPVEDRVETAVFAGTEPGQLVLRGGGDITLQRTAGTGFFTDAASIADLASQVSTALGGQAVTSVVVDNSLRAGDLFNSTWDTSDITGGNIAPLSAVMIDAGRVNPDDNYSPRSSTPATDAGRAFAAALGDPDLPVSLSETPVDVVAGAAVDGEPRSDGAEIEPLGSVRSATLATRLRDMMLHSDNLLAEAIGREVAVARGEPDTFAGAATAVLGALAQAGVPVDGAVLKDCSGMSGENRLSARILDSVLALAAGAPVVGGDGTSEDAGDADSPVALRLLLDTLPVAAADGTLSDRYLPGSGAESAAGRIRAKTGTLDGVNALAGTVTTDSGRVLTFAFLSNGSDQAAGRAALDRLAAALRRV